MATSHQRGERSAGAVAPLPSPAQVRLDEAVSTGARRVAAALAEPSGARGRDEWLAVVADCQSLINTLTAVQDAAIAQAARRESVWCEDGTLGESVHAPGRVALDAADLVAPVIGASHPQAQRRVEQAVRLAAGRAPVPADDRHVPEASGLGGLHQAMAAGQLDGYRAAVVAFELEVAPADVTDAVVSALGDHLGDDAATLRRRTRVLLSRISPDLVRERAKKARASTGLRRWVAEPGVDEWHGTFPSEDAATAWAAIDKLAHDLVAAGTCTNVEQARGKALTDLVTGNATVEVQVVLTVPAGISSPDPATDEPSADPATESCAPQSQAALEVRHHEDLVEVQGARPSEPLLVRRGWLRDHLAMNQRRSSRGPERAEPSFVPCDPLTGARLDPGDHLSTHTYRPGPRLAALVRDRDGRCRFPGCSIAARFCDLDHVRPWPTGPTAARNLLTLCRRHHRTKQRPGWHLHLAPDGTATWTDPTGRERTTAPLNALTSLVLTADTVPDRPGTPPTSATTWSALETHLELRLEHHQHPGRDQHLWLPPTHRRCTSAADLRAGLARRRPNAPIPDPPPFERPSHLRACARRPWPAGPAPIPHG